MTLYDLNFLQSVNHGIPPLPLLYSGFGQFMDIMDGHVNIPSLADINVVAELQKAVDNMATDMTKFPIDERDQNERGLSHLNEIFRACQGTRIPFIMVTHIGSVISDVL